MQCRGTGRSIYQQPQLDWSPLGTRSLAWQQKVISTAASATEKKHAFMFIFTCLCFLMLVHLRLLAYAVTTIQVMLYCVVTGEGARQ
jgi:hypothetical protein